MKPGDDLFYLHKYNTIVKVKYLGPYIYTDGKVSETLYYVSYKDKESIISSAYCFQTKASVENHLASEQWKLNFSLRKLKTL